MVFVDEVSIDQWNELDDEYSFVYANPEMESKKVLVKCLVMNDKLIVDALANGDSEPVHLEFKYDFFIIVCVLGNFSILFSLYNSGVDLLDFIFGIAVLETMLVRMGAAIILHSLRIWTSWLRIWIRKFCPS